MPFGSNIDTKGHMPAYFTEASRSSVSHVCALRRLTETLLYVVCACDLLGRYTIVLKQMKHHLFAKDFDDS